MTTLDDALGGASVTVGPHQITALWRESDNGDLATNKDSISNLTHQFNGVMTVNHSLDDGLPDPVTMTTGVEASGILEAGMNGREGLTLSTRGARAFDAASWSSGINQTDFAGTIPTAAARGDFLLCAIVIDDSTASLTQTNTDPKYNWEFLGTVIDGNVGMYLYATRWYYPGRPPIMIQSHKLVDFICLTQAFWAANPQGMPLAHRITDVQLAAEGASAVTSHSISSTLKNKAIQASFWGALPASGVWTPADTLVGSPSIVSLRLTTALTGLLDAGVRTATATSAVSTAVATLGAVTLEPFERPRLDARQYFSPLNADSPIYGFDRDTASVAASIRVGTTDGPTDTGIFSGQMQDTPVSGRQAAVQAVSRTRIRLNRTVELPIVGALREGLTADWFITWLLARGSQFVGPSPNRYTRYWAPLHGSVHPHWGSPANYSAAYYWSTDAPMALQGQKYPEWVLGPYNLGMFAQQGATRTDQLTLSARNLWNLTDSPFPHVTDAGGPILADFFSQGQSKGRMGFYIRADPATAAPSYLDTDDDFLFDAQLITSDRYGSFMSFLHIWIDSATRLVKIDMGSDAHSSSVVTFTTAGALPTDGSWRFIGIYWDFAAGSATVYHQGTSQTSTLWATNFNNGVDQLAPTDAQAAARGDVFTCRLSWHLPASEFMLNSGEAYPGTSIWADWWQSGGGLTSPGKSATMRVTRQGLVAIAEPTTVNAWDTLSEMARSTLCAYRVNEADNAEFLPPSYFGETAQITTSAVQDTRKNTGDLDVIQDTSKARNVVTVQFNETRIDSKPGPVLLWNSSVEIPTGTSYVTFPLDKPTVELHGASNTAADNYAIINLTSAQITTPTLPTDRHYVTILQKPDGTGLVYSEVQVMASFDSFDAQSVTIKFVNRTGRIVYMTNAATQVPFLQVLGYGVTSADGYSTIRDAASVTVRGERGLNAEMGWIQDRIAAQNASAALLGTVSRPRTQIALKVLGDPRRKPGQLITVLDKDGTAVAGNWRIWSVAHNVNNAEYTQDIVAVQVLPAAVWDGVDGWDEAVWS